jgi:SAM-dependent methyltransferase
MGVSPLAPTIDSGGAVMVQPSFAALAFDAIAPEFDERFSAWGSVTAQRRAVRAALLREFPAGGRILELGGGTGEDAAYLAERGFDVLLTDSSPRMVSIANSKLAPLGGRAEEAALEDLETFAEQRFARGARPFDGVFSNFAPLNCVVDLRPVARGLAKLLKPHAAAMLVVFGTSCPAEIATELLRGRPDQAFRRQKRGERPARLAGRKFSVVYHRRKELKRAFAPWFALEKRLGIGIAVPPSAAEPWISQHEWLLAAAETLDKIASRPLAALGDHVLYQFRRTLAPSPHAEDE